MPFTAGVVELSGRRSHPRPVEPVSESKTIFEVLERLTGRSSPLSRRVGQLPCSSNETGAAAAALARSGDVLGRRGLTKTRLTKGLACALHFHGEALQAGRPGREAGPLRHSGDARRSSPEQDLRKARLPLGAALACEGRHRPLASLLRR